MEVAVVIPAAGLGARLGGEPKQFRQLGGAPLLLQTARAFEHHPEVNHITVAVAARYLERTEALLKPLKKLHRVVQGGNTRQVTVSNALQDVPAQAELVLVHDAARPFVDGDLIAEVIRATTVHGAAAAAIPVADTLRYGDGKWFTQGVSRDGLYAVQTPQGFRKTVLDAAYQNAGKMPATATDDAELVRLAGQSVRIVPGHPTNLKITTPEDWDWAVRTWPVVRSIGGN